MSTGASNGYRDIAYRALLLGTAAALGAGFALGAANGPASAQGKIPQFMQSGVGWISAGPFLDPPAGMRGPIRQHPAHPFHGNLDGPGQVTPAIGNHDDPVLKPWAAAHIAVALVAYALFVVVALQALVLTGLEKQLHRGLTTTGGTPPLLTLERYLFRLIATGFWNPWSPTACPANTSAMPPRPSRSPRTYRLPERLLSVGGRTPPAAAIPATKSRQCNGCTRSDRSPGPAFVRVSEAAHEYPGRRSGETPPPLGPRPRSLIEMASGV